MAGLISIGLTGLLSHQSALSTTGNNVANANTPGYSRQRAVFETTPSLYSGAGYVGTGVTIADIQRLNSEFVNQQLRTDTTLNGGQSAMTAELARLDNLFGSESTGLNTALTGFFSAIQDSAESPDSLPQRQLLISRGESLAQRFHSISARLDEHASSLETQLTAEVAKINGLARSIAELNLAISSSPGQAQGIQPNELLDQRDEKLRQLAESVRIQVTRQSDGQVDVYMGNGQSLVSRDHANTLSLQVNPENPGQSDVFLNTGGAARRIGGDVSGGRLGALLEFRAKALIPAENALGRIAISVAAAVNEQHRKGVDLEGNQGGRFFSAINAVDPATGLVGTDRVTVNANNAGSGRIGLQLDDVSKLGVEDYVLEFRNATDYTVRRVSDGEAVADSTGAGGLPTDMSDYGFSLDMSAGSFAAGDRFRLSPTGTGARDIDMGVSRPQAVALASPLQAETGGTNIGSGAIDQGTVLDIDGPGFNADAQPAPPLLIRITGPGSYQAFDANGDPETDPPLFAGTYTPGGGLFGQTTGDANYRGYQYVISGNPEVGDTFTISFNRDNSLDNRNAVALGDISRLGLLDGGQSTLDDAYGLLVSDIGTQTSQAQQGLEASRTLLEQSNSLWQEQSGVNLDEEAGKLIQYQAAYNASAQVVSVARELFDTLLSSFR